MNAAGYSWAAKPAEPSKNFSPVELFRAGRVTAIAAYLGFTRTRIFAKLTTIFLSGWGYANTG
jgi:hypothetical protein